MEKKKKPSNISFKTRAITCNEIFDNNIIKINDVASCIKQSVTRFHRLHNTCISMNDRSIWEKIVKSKLSPLLDKKKKKKKKKKRKTRVSKLQLGLII